MNLSGEADLNTARSRISCSTTGRGKQPGTADTPAPRMRPAAWGGLPTRSLLSCVFWLLLGATAVGQSGSIVIPGGLARAAHVAQLAGFVDEPGDAGLSRLFTHLLQSEPSPGGIVMDNPTRIDLISYLEQHARLEQHLRKEGLIAANSASEGDNPAREFVAPVAGTKEEIQPARRLLSLLGIGFKIVGAAENAAIVPQFAAERLQSAPAGEKLLRTLAPEFFEDPGTAPIRFTLRAERRPIMLDAETWTSILPGKGDDLFHRFISSPEGMHLYLALASCAPETRRILTETVAPKQLLRAAERLRLFGRDLTIENGELLFPGSTAAWKEFLDAGAPDSTASLQRLLDREGALLLLSALTGAPAPVQAFLTKSPERIAAYAEVVEPYTTRGFSTPLMAAAARDLGRILRMSALRGEELVLDLDAPTANRLLHWVDPKLIPPLSVESTPLSPRIISKLLPRRGVSPLAETSRAGVIEFFRYLQNAQPEALSPESAELLLRTPESAPILLDLIGDLRPDAAVMAAYLRHCSTAMAQGRREWNPNRTRTSQALFSLISTLSREQALPQERATGLLQEALEVLSVDDEALFAMGVARFLSVRLLPELPREGASSDDPLLAALSGVEVKSRIRFQDSTLIFDRAAWRRRAMQDVMHSQSFTPLSVLLELYGVLREINGDTDEADEAHETKIAALWKTVREGLDGVRTAEWIPGVSPGDHEGVAGVRLDDIKERLEAPALGRGPAREIAADLHAELGVTLLTYCYAYSGGPSIDVMTFDPNFVRKHRFYRRSARPPAWSRAHFEQEDALGGLIEGSVVGLGFELARLETAQALGGVTGSRMIDLAPAILYGVRQVPPALRTDRSQEYVALGARLGGMLIDLAGSNPEVGRRVRSFTTSFVPGARLESDAHALSPSELFLLGHEYFKSGARDLCDSEPPIGESHCSVLSRLGEIAPKKDRRDHAAFEQEVQQYGVLLRGRIGLSRLSFELIEPYERLGDSLSSEPLYDRICDLKIRIAELNHAAGIPAALGGAQASMALTEVLPRPHDLFPYEWKTTVERINRLDQKLAPGWIRELLNNGTLILDDGLPGTPDL